MKKIILTASVLLSISASAQSSVRELVCKTKTTTTSQYFGSDVYLNIRDFNINAAGEASIKAFDFTIVNREDAYSEAMSIPAFNAGTVSGKDLTNVKYDGRKYKDHVKFELTSAENERSSGLQLEYAHLIISPEYTVIKTIDQANNWDKNWTWQVEVRKYSAVLSYSINDHHGDYLQLECLSTGTVNDSRKVKQ